MKSKKEIICVVSLLIITQGGRGPPDRVGRPHSVGTAAECTSSVARPVQRPRAGRLGAVHGDGGGGLAVPVEAGHGLPVGGGAAVVAAEQSAAVDGRHVGAVARGVLGRRRGQPVNGY